MLIIGVFFHGRVAFALFSKASKYLSDPLAMKSFNALCIQAEFMNIWLRFLGIILKVLRLEDSVYHVYITNQFQATFSQGGWGGGGKIHF
jgi:hypothetical protein